MWGSRQRGSKEEEEEEKEEEALLLLLRLALLTPSTALRAACSPQKRSRSPMATSTGSLGTTDSDEEKHLPEPRAREAAVPSGGETATSPPISTDESPSSLADTTSAEAAAAATHEPQE